MFSDFKRLESWTAVLTSTVATSLTLRLRLVRMRRQPVGLRHYHQRYHYSRLLTLSTMTTFFRSEQ